MKHKLSAILMAFMLTTPAAFAAPEAANGTEQRRVLLAPQRPLQVQPRLLLPLVAWLLALSARRRLSVWQRLLVWRRWQ